MGKMVAGVVGIVALPVVIVILVGLGVGVIGGGAMDLSGADLVNGYRLQDLEELPSYQIAYPNALHVATEERSAHRYTTVGELPAVAGRTFTSPDLSRDVIILYDSELEALGWEAVNVPHRLGANFSENTVATWRQDNLIFRLAFLDEDAIEALPGHLAFHFQITPVKPEQSDS